MLRDRNVLDLLALYLEKNNYRVVRGSRNANDRTELYQLRVYPFDTKGFPAAYINLLQKQGTEISVKMIGPRGPWVDNYIEINTVEPHSFERILRMLKR